MIFTSYFAKIRKFPENVIPVAISAIVPDWYDGLSYSLLAPDYETLMNYKITHNEDSYFNRYNETVLKRVDPLFVLNDIQLDISDPTSYPDIPFWKNPDFHVALICYEKSSDFCHRHLVAEWFRSHGIECYEWEDIQ